MGSGEGGKERVECGRLPPLLSCEEAPSINSGSFHTARSRENGEQNFIPGHALHEKGLQRQMGAGTLVNSQERRAAVVPRFNRWFCSPVGLHGNSCFRACRKTPRRVVYECLEGKRVGFILVGPTRRGPVLPVPPSPAAPPCAAPRRPARGMSRFWNRHMLIRRNVIYFPDIP